MRRLLLAASFSLFALTPGALNAQVALGGQLNWGFSDADAGVGARISGMAVRNYGLELMGSFDYFFPGDNVDYWEVNLNFAYAIPGVTSTEIEPYAGAGINIANASVDVGGAVGTASNTDVGANLLAGIKYPIGNAMTFGEVRLELGGGEQFVVTGGVMFNVWSP
jgi:hypothetical protein